MTAQIHPENIARLSTSAAKTLSARELRLSILNDLSVAADVHQYCGQTRQHATVRAQCFANTLFKINRERWLS